MRPITPPPAPLVDTLNHLEAHARRALGVVERPPGPPVSLMLWEASRFFTDQIGYIEDVARTWGDMTFSKLGNKSIYQVSSPALIEQVLVKKADYFIKGDGVRELRAALGKGLLTAENPLWKRQRKLAAPALKRRQIEVYAEAMVRHTRDWCAAREPGQIVDLHEDMMAVTLEIVVETLFGVSLERDAHEIGLALDDLIEHMQARIHSPWRLVPSTIPTPTHRRFAQAMADLDRIVYELIDRRAGGIDDDGDDLLVRLLRAKDEDGEHMSRVQLRDEVLTMFLAGHETTALAVTFAWRHLVDHPELMARMQAEVDEVLGGRDATAADVRSLAFVEAIVKETMRLTPPAWLLGREAVEDVRIGDWTIPEGSLVIMPQWVVHRDERWWDAPLSFEPDRWLDGRTDDLPRYAYFPFGGGSRVCIGNHFAMMEAILIIATMAQHRGIERTPGTPELGFIPAITMRPDRPVALRVT